jgi:hypothetical protein
VTRLRAPSCEPGAEDDVRDAALDRLDQRGHVRGVVLEIRVLDHGDVAVDVRDRRPDGGALAAVALAQHDPPVAAVVPALQDVGRLVGRAVVHDDHLPVEVERLHALEELGDRGPLVVGRNQERDPHGRSLAGNPRSTSLRPLAILRA